MTRRPRGHGIWSASNRTRGPLVRAWQAKEPGPGGHQRQAGQAVLPAGLWVINSIGVISHHGHRLLLAVLSSGQPSQLAGIRQAQAAATAAAAAITTTPPCPR